MPFDMDIFSEVSWLVLMIVGVGALTYWVTQGRGGQG